MHQRRSLIGLALPALVVGVSLGACGADTAPTTQDASGGALSPLDGAGAGEAASDASPIDAAPADVRADAPTADVDTKDAARDAPGVDAAPDAAPACPPPVVVAGSLQAFVGGFVAAMRASGGAASGAYVTPAAADRDAFARAVTLALSGAASGACALPPSYRVALVSEPALGDFRVVAEVDAAGAHAPSLYYGLYARRVDLTSTRALALEAPHPLFDTNTGDEAQDLFATTHARYLLVAGAHRCASADASPCSGTTTACGARAPYRESDAAHATAHPFAAVHRELTADPGLYFLQLHGNGASCPSALLSDGSGAWPAAGFVRALGDGLVAAGVSFGGCGDGYPNAACDLCGGGNVQGRETAGSPDACTMPGTSFGRFAHLEQLLPMRQRGAGGAVGWVGVRSAIEQSLPRL